MGKWDISEINDAFYVCWCIWAIYMAIDTFGFVVGVVVVVEESQEMGAQNGPYDEEVDCELELELEEEEQEEQEEQEEE